jgi:tRNA pseudouridine38-40 synthase
MPMAAGYRRVTNSFNSKTACDSRTYEYTMPTYAFAPRMFWPDKQAVANTGKNDNVEISSPSSHPPPSSSRVTIPNEVDASVVEQLKNRSDFVFTDEIHARVNALLAVYTGTHNFHNFTSGKLFSEQSAKRYIMSFKVCASCTCQPNS